MTTKNAIFLLLVLIGVFFLFRFIVFLTQEEVPEKFKIAVIPSSSFPICQGSNESNAIMAIQKSLNKTKKTFFTPYLDDDGIFGPATEWELKNQTQSICVSELMYHSMV